MPKASGNRANTATKASAGLIRSSPVRVLRRDAACGPGSRWAARSRRRSGRSAGGTVTSLRMGSALNAVQRALDAGLPLGYTTGEIAAVHRGLEHLEPGGTGLVENRVVGQGVFHRPLGQRLQRHRVIGVGGGE